MNNKLKKQISKAKNIIGSAAFGMIITVFIFMYETNQNTEETAKIVDNLTQIQYSLSTRYLGIFPEYLGCINVLLHEANEHHKTHETKDSVIICEDVLYYGVRRDMAGFQEMLKNLTLLSRENVSITIAFYDIKGEPFKEMIKNGQISSENQSKYNNEFTTYKNRIEEVREFRRNLPKNLSKEESDAIIQKKINENFNNYLKNTNGLSTEKLRYNLYNEAYIDSILCEKYYNLTRSKDSDKFSNKIKALLRPLPKYENATDDVTSGLNKLYYSLDSTARTYLQKPIDKISYHDMESMYKNYSILIFNYLKDQPNIELIPLREDIAMCCWMNILNGKSKAIIAFPSKYSTDEIGFISQDEAFSKYILTMLSGIKLTHEIHSKERSKS